MLRQLILVQNATGLLFSTFLTVHLAGHALTLCPSCDGSDGLSVANRFLHWSRAIYHRPAVEALLIVSTVAHIGR